MNKKLHISIPSPCHEKWQDMTPAEKGRFCASCQKVVRDFTGATDREIALVLGKEKNVCGRFNESQLNRELYIPKEKKPIWVAASAALVSFLALGNNEIIAQTLTSTEQQPQQNKHGAVQFTNISGTVKDSMGYPLPGVSIINLNTTTAAHSDFDGIFNIKAQYGDKIQFTYSGHEDSIVIIENNIINVVMTERLNNEVLVIEVFRNKTEKHFVGAVTTISFEQIQDRAKQPTFFGRMFRKIGNLFRKNE